MRWMIVAVAVFALAGCAADPTGEPPDTQPSSRWVTPSSRTPLPSATRSLSRPASPPGDDYPLPPLPDQATRTAYLADLDAIDPDIVHGRPDKAVDRGRQQCTALKQFTGDRDRLVHMTNEWFVSPNHPNGFGVAVAARILAVLHARLCPGFPAP